MIKITTFQLLLLTLVLYSCQSTKHSSVFSKNKLEKVNNSKEINDYLGLIRQKNIAKQIATNKELNNNYDCNLEITEKDTECLGQLIVVGSSISPSLEITNNQVEGVDEGDIIKHYKNMLVVLRKGKLYSIDISGDDSQVLTKLDQVDAFSPSWKHEAFFDEMLIDDGIVLVLGFNYDFYSSEIIRFNLSNDGIFSYMDNYLIKSDDYFDSENYASRLFNHQYTTSLTTELITNLPIEEQIPKISKVPDNFNGDKKELLWNPLIEISDIYFPIQSVLNPTLYSFIVCPLDENNIICNGIGIISSRSWNNLHYNNGNHIYMWSSAWTEEAMENKSIDTFESLYEYKRYLDSDEIIKDIDDLYQPLMYRISLKDFDVDAIQVDGMPTSQFSFHHQNNTLYMYGLIDTNMAQLVKMPDNRFDKTASMSSILITEILGENSLSSTQRFIGDSFVIGHKGLKYLYDDYTVQPLNIININDGQTRKLNLPHHANRIEIIDDMTLVVGNTIDDNLGLSIFSLDNTENIIQTFLTDRLEGEKRSHAFNYAYIDDYLLAGITTQDKDKAEYENGEYWWDGNTSSDISFFGGIDSFDYIDELVSDVRPNKDCEVSCDDWYGNSRPFFIGNRIFALTGDEIIEAELIDGKISEINRLNMTEYKGQASLK